jgi:8-oxo-dGTP pyrophosphatase MutT (NUDIX family)
MWESRTPRPTTTIMVDNGKALLMAHRQRHPGKDPTSNQPSSSPPPTYCCFSQGLLDFPGGFVRAGETIIRGAQRELEEEFGLVGPACTLFHSEGVPELYAEPSRGSGGEQGGLGSGAQLWGGLRAEGCSPSPRLG